MCLFMHMFCIYIYIYIYIYNRSITAVESILNLGLSLFQKDEFSSALLEALFVDGSFFVPFCLTPFCWILIVSLKCNLINIIHTVELNRRAK